MKSKILIHAIRLAAKHGFSHITREQVAKSAKVAPGLVSYYFNNMKGLQSAVMSEAVNTENLAVVAQGLAAGHKIAAAASKALRLKALQAIGG